MIIRRVTFGGHEYQLKCVRCCRKTCNGCPHGPYWYLIIRLRDGRTVVRYIGKHPPQEVLDRIAEEDRT